MCGIVALHSGFSLGLMLLLVGAYLWTRRQGLVPLIVFLILMSLTSRLMLVAWQNSGLPPDQGVLLATAPIAALLAGALLLYLYEGVAATQLAVLLIAATAAVVCGLRATMSLGARLTNAPLLPGWAMFGSHRSIMLTLGTSFGAVFSIIVLIMLYRFLESYGRGVPSPVLVTGALVAAGALGAVMLVGSASVAAEDFFSVLWPALALTVGSCLILGLAVGIYCARVPPAVSVLQARDSVLDRLHSFVDLRTRLSESEKRSFMLFELSNDAVFFHSSEGHLHAANHSACTMLGYSRPALLRMTLMDFVAPEARAELEQMLQQVRETGQAVFYSVFLGHDGRRIPVELSSSQVEFDGETTILSVVRNLAEREAFIAELRRHNQELRVQAAVATAAASATDETEMLTRALDAVLELIPDSVGAVSVYDDQQREFRNAVSRGLEEAINLPSEKQDDGRLEISDQPAAQFWDDVQREAPQLAGRLPRNIRTFAIVPLKGRSRVLGAINIGCPQAAALRAPDHALLQTIGDILGVALENHRLASEVRRSDRLAAVGELAASVAHEFNNLLAGMQGYAQLAQALGTEEAIRKVLDTVADGCRRGADIARNLLSFARPEAPERKRCNIVECVEAALRLAHRELENAHVEVVRSYSPDTPPVYADRSQMQQVFLNLIINAEHAMPNGGRLTVEVAVAPPSDGDEAEFVRVSVRDTGVGIPPQHLKSIFDPFFTTKTQEGSGRPRGTGLGLSVVRSIVAAHQGRIEVESAVGRGTTFHIYVPVAAADAEEAEAGDALTLAQGQPSGPKLRVLLADDEEALRDVLTDFLTMLGHEVLTASDGAEALQLLAEQKVDVVVSDLLMPHVNGTEILAAAKRLERPCPVILITGQDDQEMEQEVLQAGALAVIRKPFDLAHVRQVLEQAAQELARANAVRAAPRH